MFHSNTLPSNTEQLMQEPDSVPADVEDPISQFRVGGVVEHIYKNNEPTGYYDVTAFDDDSARTAAEFAAGVPNIPDLQRACENVRKFTLREGMPDGDAGDAQYEVPFLRTLVESLKHVRCLRIESRITSKDHPIWQMVAGNPELVEIVLERSPLDDGCVAFCEALWKRKLASLGLRSLSLPADLNPVPELELLKYIDLPRFTNITVHGESFPSDAVIPYFSSFFYNNRSSLQSIRLPLPNTTVPAMFKLLNPSPHTARGRQGARITLHGPILDWVQTHYPVLRRVGQFDFNKDAEGEIIYDVQVHQRK